MTGPSIEAGHVWTLKLMEHRFLPRDGWKAMKDEAPESSLSSQCKDFKRLLFDCNRSPGMLEALENSHTNSSFIMSRLGSICRKVGNI